MLSQNTTATTAPIPVATALPTTTSTTTPMHTIQVCGRAIAYRRGYNDGFSVYHFIVNITLMGSMWMDSVSHMDHYEHISGHSLVVSSMEPVTLARQLAAFSCPCDHNNTYGSPPFVGND